MASAMPHEDDLSIQATNALGFNVQVFKSYLISLLLPGQS
jgi:hypothetical protein